MPEPSRAVRPPDASPVHLREYGVARIVPPHTHHTATAHDYAQLPAHDSGDDDTVRFAANKFINGKCQLLAPCAPVLPPFPVANPCNGWCTKVYCGLAPVRRPPSPPAPGTYHVSRLAVSVDDHPAPPLLSPLSTPSTTQSMWRQFDVKLCVPEGPGTRWVAAWYPDQT